MHESVDYNGLLVTFLEKDSFADYEIRKFSLALVSFLRCPVQRVLVHEWLIVLSG